MRSVGKTLEETPNQDDRWSVVLAERAGLQELADLGRRFEVPVFEDLGSGWLGLPDVETPQALRDEPSVTGSLAAGADLVAFSGDKLLGGPQAGIVVGRRPLIDRVRQHPLMRAVRADKTTYAALEATLALWAQPARRSEIPVYRMLTAPLPDIEARARRLASGLSALDGVTAEVVAGASTTGGGSAPDSMLETRLVRVTADRLTASRLDEQLRASEPPIIGRIERDRLMLDARTLSDEEAGTIVPAIGRAVELREV